MPVDNSCPVELNSTINLHFRDIPRSEYAESASTLHCVGANACPQVDYKHRSAEMGCLR